MSRLALLLLSTALLSLAPSPARGRVFTRCQLSKELIRYNFLRHTVSSWVCLLENESGRATNRINVFANSTSYGLFQINSNSWCKKGRKGGLCSMKCEDLLNDNLSDDVRCAKRVYQKQGFFGWGSWKTRCQGRTLPDLSQCT